MASTSGIGTFVNEKHELATEAIDIFAIPQAEKSMIHGKTITYYPSGVITDNGPYEFIMPNDSNEYTMLDKTTIFGECEVVKADGTALDAAAKISVSNNFPQTLFRQIEVYLNNQCINDLSTPTYAYKAFIENHLTYDKDIKDTTLKACEMYIKDTIGKESDITAGLTDTKSGFSTRKELITGKKIYFDIVPHIDFLQCKKFLLPGVEMKIRLIRNEDTFSTVCAAGENAKIKINKLELRVRRICLDPGVSGAIESALESQPAVYPIAHSKIRTFLLNTNTQSQYISQMVRGKLPRSFIICFVESKAFDGDAKFNPFHFQHFDLNYMNVFVNGEPIHPKAIQPSWDADYLSQYRWFLDNIGLHQNFSNGITMEEFKSNSCFFTYDMSPDLCNGFYTHGLENGTIDINLGFKAALTKNVTMIFFATYNETIVIDKIRNVSVV